MLLLLLIYLQGPRALSPIEASLLLLPGYLISAAVNLYAGRLADQRGPVLPATLGLALQDVSLLRYAQLTNGTPLWWAFYESVSFMVIAAILSAFRGGRKKGAKASRS